MATKPALTAKTVRIPINNVYGGGDYTAQMIIGSENAVVKVIMDTGSSTLAVKQGTYKPKLDKNLKPSTFAQDVTYGPGGWAGPVLQTTLTMGVKGNAVTLQTSPIAVADDQQPHNFGATDGVLGLAYNALNSAYNPSTFLQARGINPAVTYPWPFPPQCRPSGWLQAGERSSSAHQIRAEHDFQFDHRQRNELTGVVGRCPEGHRGFAEQPEPAICEAHSTGGEAPVGHTGIRSRSQPMAGHQFHPGGRHGQRCQADLLAGNLLAAQFAQNRASCIPN